LISNAIKYRSAEPPRIVISAVAQDGLWKFAVRDNGIGIDPAYHKQIFDMFNRLHGPQTAGHGIGLTLCLRIMESLGGHLWVESAPGKGATFYFTLPKA
jgi:signal transduction histidine kinase